MCLPSTLASLRLEERDVASSFPAAGRSSRRNVLHPCKTWRAHIFLELL